MTNRREATLEMYRSNFEAFAGFAFRELNGGKPMEMNWHIPLMADWLEKVRTSRIRRGIISMPPRNLKSLFAYVFLPAFALGKAPAKQIILIAGNQRLAGEMMDKLQRLARSSRFRDIFPHVKASRQSAEIYTSQGGSIRTALVGQQLSGAGADLIIIDDPLSPSQAKIKQKREGVNEWFDAEVLTRLNERASGALLLVMQRVHPEDLCAHVHSRQPSVEQLVIEAVAYKDKTWTLSDGRTVTFRQGHALQPKRESLEQLVERLQEIGSFNFIGQYLQGFWLPWTENEYRTPFLWPKRRPDWKPGDDIGEGGGLCCIPIAGDILVRLFGYPDPAAELTEDGNQYSIEEWEANAIIHQAKLVAAALGPDHTGMQ